MGQLFAAKLSGRTNSSWKISAKDCPNFGRNWDPSFQKNYPTVKIRVDFFERKTAKINSSYGSIGHFDRVELSLGFGVPHGHIQSSHFQRPCVVYGELFLPFFRGIHILDSYDAGLPAPFWASSLEKPRHCRPNFAQHRTSGVKKKLSRL